MTSHVNDKTTTPRGQVEHTHEDRAARERQETWEAGRTRAF